MKNFSFIVIFLFLSSCNTSEQEFEHFNNDTEGFIPVAPNTFFLRGRIWSPGADDPSTMTENHFPISGAVISAWSEEISPPVLGGCNQCEEIPNGVPTAVSATDGTFILKLKPETKYFISIRKGDFFRITEYNSGQGGDSTNFDVDTDTVKPSMFTLPNHDDPMLGDTVPRILIIVGRGELFMGDLFDALGMVYGVDYHEIEDSDAGFIAENLSELKKYHIIIATCGDEALFLKKPEVKANLKQYVKEGGRLYIDDFAYDWAEQIWPEFLSFKVENTLDFETGICGNGLSAPSEIGQCVNYQCYDAQGVIQDEQISRWVDKVNTGNGISLKYGCNVIHTLGEGVQGECTDLESPHCLNGKLVGKPKVLLSGNWLDYVENPMTVSWKYYCGRVLYTVYHTHADDKSDINYKLILQEKIMLYLLMELQKCTTPNIID
ncbi:MAG: hypothetical protein JXR95_02300 [Deltaproteobacteria bacterium]|nr:hypothetical protein [Deltaproteobacteria bacterium]